MILFKAVNYIYHALLDFIYPPYCSFCQSSLSDGKYLVCDACWDNLPFFPKRHDILIELEENLNGESYLSGANAVWEFKKNIQFIIHQLKYEHHTCLANKIGYYMANLLREENCLDCVSLIIPVPLHKKRIRKRGYNQSELIGETISQIVHVPINTTSLQRVKNTISQTKLDRHQRTQNVADAFNVIKKEEIEGKKIVLIDDVITTGSTINACARELKQNGAEEVFALSAVKA